MSEYIFDVPDSNQPIAGESALYYPDERDEPMAVGEEIVRCRDCRFSLAHGNGCGRNQDIYDVEPNGFCAWAERRNA